MSGEPNCRITPRVFRKLDGQYYIIYHVGIRNVAAETKHPSISKRILNQSEYLYVLFRHDDDCPSVIAITF